MIKAIAANRLIASAFGLDLRPALRAVDGLPGRTQATGDPTNEAELYPQPIDSVEIAGADRDGSSVRNGFVASERSSSIFSNEAWSKLRASASPAASTASAGRLTSEEEQQIRKLKKRDSEVRRHEQAHKAAAGSTARGGPQFEFETGPDGKRYAVGGEVNIDTSAVSGNPRATIAKMQQVRRAALAPAEPSAQDRAVATQAQAAEQKARAELAEERQPNPTGSEAESTQAVGRRGRVTNPPANNTAHRFADERPPALIARAGRQLAGLAPGSRLDVIA